MVSYIWDYFKCDICFVVQFCLNRCEMEKKDEKKKGFSENVKIGLVAALTLVILTGSILIFWQIDSQNRSAATGSGTDDVKSQIDALNQKIDDLNKALNQAKQTQTTETTVQQSTSSNSSSTSQTGIVNINTASAAQLDSLPGIGTTYAQRIIDYRQANGPFKTIDEIQNIKGIGPATFAKLKDQITV